MKKSQNFWKPPIWPFFVLSFQLTLSIFCFHQKSLQMNSLLEKKKKYEFEMKSKLKVIIDDIYVYMFVRLEWWSNEIIILIFFFFSHLKNSRFQLFRHRVTFSNIWMLFIYYLVLLFQIYASFFFGYKTLNFKSQTTAFFLIFKFIKRSI